MNLFQNHVLEDIKTTFATLINTVFIQKSECTYLKIPPKPVIHKFANARKQGSALILGTPDMYSEARSMTFFKSYILKYLLQINWMMET